MEKVVRSFHEGQIGINMLICSREILVNDKLSSLILSLCKLHVVSEYHYSPINQSELVIANGLRKKVLMDYRNISISITSKVLMEFRQISDSQEYEMNPRV